MRNRLHCLWGSLLAIVAMLAMGSAGAVAHGQTTGSDASAYFHPTIVTESDYVANLQYASFSVKYTIDRGKIKNGDYVEVTVPDALNHVSLAVSSLLFSGKQDLGQGKYRLIFNDQAVNGISGSFSISAFGNNDTYTAKNVTVTVGKTSKTILVGAGRHHQTGTTTETRAIVKWAYGGEGYRQDTATTGVYDPARNATIDYAVSVDPRLSTMKNATLIDPVPDAATIDTSSIRIMAFNQDGSWAFEVPHEQAATMASVKDNTLTIRFGDRLDGSKSYRVHYTVTVPQGTNVAIRNTAALEYDSDSSPTHRDVEASTFTVKPMSGYSASLGYKSVDKTEVSDDPNDQTVTYTISFENDQQFAAGEINLTDRLAPDVTYVDSYGSDYFSLRYDQASHAVHISNTKAIPASMKQDVTIVTDFSKVKMGQTVSNTVGGNTVKTKKTDGALTLTAHKSVDGEHPGQRTFEFQLLDANGTVLQTKRNDEDGTVSFDPIYYTGRDGGRTFTYRVRESTDHRPKGYVFDDSVYTVTVTPIDTDNDHEFECVPTISRDGSPVDAISFDNATTRTQVFVSEKLIGMSAGSRTVYLLANGKETGRSVTLNAANDWEASFANLPEYDENGVKIIYTIRQEALDGHALHVSGNADSGFVVTDTLNTGSDAGKPAGTLAATGSTWTAAMGLLVLGLFAAIGIRLVRR